MAFLEKQYALVNREGYRSGREGIKNFGSLFKVTAGKIRTHG